MNLSLTQYEHTVKIIIIVPLTLSPLCLLLLVRLGGYTVNLCSIYFYNLIGKLTVSLQLQEFSFHNLTVDSSTSTVRRSPLKSKVGNILTKATSLRRNLNIKDATPHVRLCGKFTTQPHVCHTCSKREVLFFFN